MRSLTKCFGSTRALADVTFDLAAGEALALMGANGAGKSTLVKILCGVHGADAGSISIRGTAAAFASPGQARAHGLVAVHQSIADVGVPTLSVADNLLLDRVCAVRAPIWVGGRRSRRAAAAIAAGSASRSTCPARSKRSPSPSASSSPSPARSRTTRPC